MENLSHILGARCFYIPENQRGFSWKETHVEELISDLRLAGKKAHYMGPIIVTRDNSGDEEDDSYTPVLKCILEDGQQRLTSFFILMRNLQLRFEKIDGGESIESRELSKILFYTVGGKQRLRVKNLNTDLNACFEHHMGDSTPLPANPTAPMRSMLEVTNYSREHFYEMDRDECVRWKNRFVNQAKFILVDLDSAGVDRYLTFDAINSRGLPLSQFDKIKNFCILLNDRRSLKTYPEKKWYEALQNLDKYSVSQRSSEEAFITELFNVFHDMKVSQGDVHDEFVLTYRPLLEKTDPSLEGDLISFIRIWAEYAESYGFLSSKEKKNYYGKNCTVTAGSWLDRLDNMELPTITRPILVSGHMKMNKKDFEELVKACEKYTFRVHAVLARRKDKNATGIIGLANGILRNTKGLTFAFRTICNWVSKMAPMRQVIDKIGNGEPKYPFATGITGWSYCYYFLYEYEVHASPSGVSPLPWGLNREEKKNTQEHILPQQHRDNNWWEKEWPDEAKADKFKHRLGNLVLSSGNSELGRKPISEKLEDLTANYYYNCLNATNSEKLITGFTDGFSWNETNILKREFSLLQFATTRWSIPCSCDNGNIYLSTDFSDIGCDFINIQERNCYQGIDEDNDNDVLEDIYEDFSIIGEDD